MSSFLDKTGLSYFWEKIKSYITQQIQSVRSDIPTELPNPHLLTIGVGNYPAITYYTYDGSKNVTLSINENTLKIFDAVYPVGSIYMSTSSTNPEYIFGGTWEQIQDMFLLAAGSKYEAGTTGGEAEHTLTQMELPKISGSFGGTSSGNAWGVLGTSSGVFSRSGSIPAPTNTEKSADNTRNTKINMSFGGGQAHNNMPPYLAVYVWKRVS